MAAVTVAGKTPNAPVYLWFYCSPRLRATLLHPTSPTTSPPPHLHIHVWLLNDRDREGERRRDNLEDEVKQAGSVRMTKDKFIDSVQDGNTRTYRHTHTHTRAHVWESSLLPADTNPLFISKWLFFFSLSLFRPVAPGSSARPDQWGCFF